MKINYQARFSGRQKLAAVLSPTKAGCKVISCWSPRAALRFTSFRYAGPGLNSSTGFAGSLNSSHLKLIWLSAICVALVFFSGCNRPGTSGGSPATSGSSPEPVSSSLDVVKIKAESVAIALGGNADATVVLAISPGFHINANPATFPYLIATALEVGNGYGMITAGKPVYPVAQKRRFKFAEQPLAVYEDEVRLTLPLRATPKATKGPVSLPISVMVQACDEEKCYPPGRLNAMIPVEVK
jgi:Disulphide bond corrector protein DsbC